MENALSSGKAPHTPKKIRIPRMVHAFSGTLFVVKKNPKKRLEQDILVHFGSEAGCHVVKLGTGGFPKTDANGRPVTWIGNFGILNEYDRYVDGVKYTLILPALPEGMVYVNYEKGDVKDLVLLPIAQPSQVVLAELTSGDPPVGWRPT